MARPTSPSKRRHHLAPAANAGPTRLQWDCTSVPWGLEGLKGPSNEAFHRDFMQSAQEIDLLRPAGALFLPQNDGLYPFDTRFFQATFHNNNKLQYFELRINIFSKIGTRTPVPSDLDSPSASSWPSDTRKAMGDWWFGQGKPGDPFRASKTS